MAITHVKGDFFSSKHSSALKDFGFHGQGDAKGGAIKADYAKGGSSHSDAKQDKALISKMINAAEAKEGVDHLAKGGKARLPRSMKSSGLQPHSPINTPPRNPMMTQTPTGDTPGGVVPYGVQPSVEPGAMNGDGPAPTVPATGMKKGGRMTKPSVKQRY